MLLFGAISTEQCRYVAGEFTASGPYYLYLRLCSRRIRLLSLRTAAECMNGQYRQAFSHGGGFGILEFEHADGLPHQSCR